MTCDNAKNAIELLITGNISQSGEIQLNQHVETCNQCKQKLEQLKSTWNLSGNIRFPPVNQAKFAEIEHDFTIKAKERKFNETKTQEHEE